MSRSRGSAAARRGGHQLGGVAVIEELGERVGAWWEVTADDRVAAWGVGPFPLDDPFEEHAEHPRRWRWVLNDSVVPAGCRAGRRATP